MMTRLSDLIESLMLRLGFVPLWQLEAANRVANAWRAEVSRRRSW